MLAITNNAKNYASTIYPSLSKKRPSTNQSLGSLKLCFYPCTHCDFCLTARAFLPCAKIRPDCFASSLTAYAGLIKGNEDAGYEGVWC